MTYIDDNLIKGETVIQKAEIHWFIYMRGIALLLLASFMPDGAGALSVLFVIFGLLSLLSAFIHLKTAELAVTNKRVIAKYGLISRQTIELNLSKVEGLSVNQSIMGRVFHFGDIFVNGTGGKSSPIRYIRDPLHFRKKVNEQLEITSQS